MRKTILATVCVAALAASAHAQQVSTYSFERKSGTNEPQQVLLDKVRVEQGLKVAIETKPVTNAPYSAEAVNETVQTLPDGNRIVHRNVTRVYRDSAGRTRRETLDADGTVALTSITDPASGTSYMFDQKTNTVSQSKVAFHWSESDKVASGTATTSATTQSGGPVTMTFTMPDHQKAESGAASHIVIREGVAGGVTGGTVTHSVVGMPLGETSKEDLGQQAIEGVSAKGTRTTTTIPAGTVGNEQPIKIVSEEWTSPDLQVLVMTRHSDPRTGETTYRLTNISRTEPAKSLFEVPDKK
jgi:hypothetical protein